MNSIYKNIVIPIDLSDKHSIKSVIPIALNFVNAFDSKLHFVNIISDFAMKMIEDYLPKDWISVQKIKHEDQIKELVRKYIPHEIQVDFYVGRGSVLDEVKNYCTTIKADLIIVSAVRPQLRDYMLGSNASKIVRYADISVLVIRE